ncbi:CpaF family protein [Sneathiella sp. CAU 1612]|uniref:CpaF family protein n=1 Tax=Sneathiella sedimenti TaxID=2816034 RepID=A0ABS3F5V3_9PROT|nr:CpaF family protein [Sneathiella sedimenti]MBO0333759.1 CpaF family protein [Sneathiella sedimenti]
MFGRKTESERPGGVAETDEAYIGKPGPREREFDVPPELVDRVRKQFFNRIDPTAASTMPPEQLSMRITEAVSKIVDEEKLQVNWMEQSAIARELFDDIVGIGPIENLLSDPKVTDILVNGPDTVYVERGGRLELTSYKFRDDDHVLEVARRIAASVGRRVDEANPMVDARLKDGSRVNVIAPPLSVYGTIISIRKFSKEFMSLNDLGHGGSCSPAMVRFLEIAARCRLNILISGGTGSGKTTLLNALSGLIDENERIVTIEDAAEIALQRPHVVSLETRQRNTEGTGEVSQRDLLRNSLRMRPDRIIIGEVRGPEVYDMLQAMNTGHDGSMSTIHANSARDALLRLENLILSTLSNYQSRGARQQIASALDLVIHVERGASGRRFIREISEIVALEGDVITSQTLFEFVEGAARAQGNGEVFRCTGGRPHFEEKIGKFGLLEDMQEALHP